MSAFHRVDDILQLPAHRFALLAERLPHYSGAVRAAMMKWAEEAPAEEAEGTVITPAEAAMLPTLPGMPALFEFTGEGV